MYVSLMKGACTDEDPSRWAELCERMKALKREAGTCQFNAMRELLLMTAQMPIGCPTEDPMAATADEGEAPTDPSVRSSRPTNRIRGQWEAIREVAGETTP